MKRNGIKSLNRKSIALGAVLACTGLAWGASQAEEPPPFRKMSEVLPVIGAAASGDARKTSKNVNIVLVWGPKDHGPGEHDYPQFKNDWEPLFKGIPGVTFTSAENKPSDQQWETADLIVWNLWGENVFQSLMPRIDAFQARGGAMMVIGAANITTIAHAPELAKRIGLAYELPNTRWRETRFRLDLTASPLALGLPKSIQFVDEPYWKLVGDYSKINAVANFREENVDEPQIFTFEKGKAKVWVNQILHFTWTYKDPFWRVLFLRGMAWCLNESFEPFKHLSLEGADVIRDVSVTLQADMGRLRVGAPGMGSGARFFLDGRSAPSPEIHMPGMIYRTKP